MPRPGSACSSYLVQTEDAAVLLDLGSGALGKLQLAIDYARLDAIVISHMHADHFLDLVPLRYGLKYGEPPRAERIPLWLPPGGCNRLQALRQVIGSDDNRDFFDGAFRVREYDPAEALEFGDLRLSFSQTRHYIDAFAIRADFGGRGVTYSADTAPCDGVVRHARDSAVFLCESTLGLAEEEGERGHTSAREAGEMASRARVGRLVLTHYPASCPPEALVAAAQQQFAGLVDIATDGLEIAL
jgi:ribonuclease BN (tRNA processing enzyme)